MGRTASQYTRPAPVTGTLPYGGIMDDTSSVNGTKCNEAVVGDIVQFFLRMAADAGINLNGLPDNSTNGWQYVQSLMKVIYGMSLNYMSGVCPNTTTPVLIGGMTKSTLLGETHVSPGVVLYNGQWCVFTGGQLVLAAGNDVFFTVATVDGMSVLTMTQMATGTANGAALFDYNTLITLAQGIGVSGLGAWQTPTVNAGYSVADFQYRLKADGTVQFRGIIQVTSATPSATLMTLPAGYRPATVARGFPSLINTGAALVPTTVVISTACAVNFTFTYTAAASGQTIMMDGITYDTE